MYYSRGETKEEVEIKKEEMTTKAENDLCELHNVGENITYDSIFDVKN